jgi:hypothetical protein
VEPHIVFLITLGSMLFDLVQEHGQVQTAMARPLPLDFLDSRTVPTKEPVRLENQSLIVYLNHTNGHALLTRTPPTPVSQSYFGVFNLPTLAISL